MCMCVPACLYVHHVSSACGDQKRVPDVTGVTAGLGSDVGYWQLNPGPLEDQQVLTSESSFQTLTVGSLRLNGPACNSSTGKLRQEKNELKASLDYIVRLAQNTKKECIRVQNV